MPLIQAAELEQIGVRLFDALGSPHDESEIVSQVLVRSSLMGHDSHGVLRYPQYVQDLQNGELNPGARFEILHETASSALVEGHQSWGMVIARKAMQLAIEKARNATIGLVVVRGSQHIGRVGEYPSMAAAENMIGMAIINSYGVGGCVAPWGGLEGRMAPNPLAFAIPTGQEWPILVDVTTSAVPEGKVRVAKYAGELLPEGCMLDANGEPIVDPDAFYGPPMGSLLPLGGSMGHKGYGLGIVAELLAGVLSGVGFSGEQKERKGNGVFFQAINVESFAPLEEFTQQVQDQIAWIKSARRAQGVSEILIPGEPEYRTSQKRIVEGIPVTDTIWEDIQSAATKLKVTL